MSVWVGFYVTLCSILLHRHRIATRWAKIGKASQGPGTVVFPPLRHRMGGVRVGVCHRESCKRKRIGISVTAIDVVVVVPLLLSHRS